ncbi:MAG: hypothetical protein EOO99_00915 [Pedobacter sp.]|nr:MAG: hypothetical protein EOO99_00915 [Pedobacter sp.]
MQEESQSNKIDRNKIYFLIIVIASLLGINAYLFLKNKQEKNQVVTVSTEKDRLNLELEKIEVELDRVNALNVTLSDKLQEEQKLARDKIEELKIALKKGQLTLGDLDKAQRQITQLRIFVKNYQDDILKLEKENSYLKEERDSLKTSVRSYSQKAEELSKQNENLSAKVKVGEALKTSNINIKAYRVRSNGKNVLVEKANLTNKFILNFQIAENSLAQKSNRRIYLRVFDPSGNLIANDNDYFEAHGQQMQFSTQMSLNFDNTDTVYVLEWTNPKEFIKGIYSLIIYCDGYEMGKGQITLK